MLGVSSQTELNLLCALSQKDLVLCANRGQRKVIIVATDYSPQMVRPEDGGERRRTSNLPARVLAELHKRSQNRKPHFLHRKTNRI